MNGFYDGDEFIPVRFRGDLAGEPLQRRCESAARAGRHFICGCSAHRLTLFPVETPGGNGWTVRCAPWENYRHARDCFARAEFDDAGAPGRRPRVVFLPSILLAPTESEPRKIATPLRHEDRRHDGERPRYGTLTELVQSLLEVATMRAFRAENSFPATYRDANLRNPATDDIFWEFLGQLSQPVFPDGTSVFEAAARANLRVVWGVTPLPLAGALKGLVSGNHGVPFVTSGCWGEAGPERDPQEFSVAWKTAQAMGGKVAAFGRIIDAPYFFFLTTNRSDEVARIVVVPVASALQSLRCVESEPERSLVCHLLEDGVALLKPNGLADFSILGPRLWPALTTDDRGYLPRRPDLIVFCRGISVVQLMGSTDPDYVARVELSIAELQDHLQHQDVIFRTVSLTDIIGPALKCLVAILRRGLALMTTSSPSV